MMGGYTKGPWEWCDCPVNCGFIHSGDQQVAQVTFGNWGDEYATLKQEGTSIEGRFQAVTDMIVYGSVPVDEAKANARLIAAAPDLYEALQGLIDALPSAEEMAATGQVEGPGLVAARAALAKAKAGGA